MGGTPQRPAKGLVVHVEVGTEAGTNVCFQNPSFQASSHFGCANDGSLDQWVDTDQVAWAEVAGNPGWISVETEGMPDTPLTGAQVASIGRLFAWLQTLYGFPSQTCDHDGAGLTTHAHYPSGVADAAWGGHPCPGSIRSAQLPAILAASGGTDVPAPTDFIKHLGARDGVISGYWHLTANGTLDRSPGSNWQPHALLRSDGHVYTFPYTEAGVVYNDYADLPAADRVQAPGAWITDAWIL